MTPNAEREAPPLWEQYTTREEVREFAARVFAQSLHGYMVSCALRDSEEMRNYVLIMRNISTRLDQFRRMKEKQWAKSAPQGRANAKGEM